ncbi:MAG: EAL domain-containing protein [Solirubrobacteraceae bacterium]|nr:EAL domain-containing protein [Solirubrobacteraceae bacterium]
MVTLGEFLRWVLYRLRCGYYWVVRRLMRGDRLLWSSERRFRALLEAAPDAMVIVNDHGHITLVNAQAERLFGYRRQELVGQSISILIPKRLHAQHRQHVKGYVHDAVARPMGNDLELHGMRKDGSEFPVEISLSPIETDEGTMVSSAIRDISARKRQLVELQTAEELFRGAFDGSPIGMALTDHEGRIVRVNGALCALTGRSAQELAGRRFDTLTHPDDAGAERPVVGALLSGERTQYKAETRFLHASGSPIWVSLQATTIADAADAAEDAGDGAAAAPRRFLVQVEDVTHRRHYEENLHYLATHDPLTGLYNRTSFARQLEAHADVVRRYGSNGALLLLDLDHFKYVNDTLGHAAGDQLIARVATMLAKQLRDSDVLARLGGDEFAVLLPHATAGAAKHVAADLLDALRAERIAVPGTTERTMTASIGVALFEAADDLRGEDVLVNADLAMYDAKEAGRNQLAVHVSGEQAQARMRGRITWAERIRVALDEQRFVYVAQPIVDLGRDTVTQFEVLLRMRDDDGELIAPGAFLSTAERLGMIQQVDAMTVGHALRAMASCGGHAGPAAPRVEINLSGASMGDPQMLRSIERELLETGIDPARVIFEITETAAIANIGRAREFSDQLARLGCRFALDDFGAGFGSFYYLKHVRFDILKIDGEFVRDCVTSSTDRLVIRSVVDIACGLGKETIAEHVGDDATVALLRELGVTYGQGYHLGRPQPLEGFLAELYRRPASLA